MGVPYNISDTGGQVTDGVDQWRGTLDLKLPNSSMISGDFNVVNPNNGNILGEADKYQFSALSNPSYGTLWFNTKNGQWRFRPDWDVIRGTGSDQVVSFTVTGTNGGNSDTDTVTINLLICVARGTRIATPRGEVPVEDLLPGDLVNTIDGPAQPVRWVGSRVVHRDEMAANPALCPVRIRAGALGPDLPRRDLLVSPQHRILLEDWRAQLMFGEGQVLVPAKALTNDCSIRLEQGADGVEYFHVLFDDHQIMLTEGLPTESFQPQSFALNGMDRAVRDELLMLFPDLAQRDGYGDSARLSLRPWEAKLLLQKAAA